MDQKLNDWLKAHEREMIENTRELCRIDSVKADPQPGAPFGAGVRRALDAALDLAGRMGFRTKNLDGYIGYAEIGQGGDSFAILGHLDVVPVGEGWKHPPFGAEIDGDRLYGRGVSDDKSPLVISLYAAKAVSECCGPMKKTVRVIFGCDEESGWEDIRYYMLNDQMPLVGVSPDAFYPVINVEKGICHLKFFAPTPASESDPLRALNSGTRPNVVPALAEAEVLGVEDLSARAQERSGRTPARLEADGGKLRCLGTAAHGASPASGVNAAAYLIDFLCALPLPNTPLTRALKTLNKRVGLYTDGRGMGLDLADEASGGLTCNLGVLRLSERGLEGSLDIRHPISYTAQEMLSAAALCLREGGFTAEIQDAKPPLYVPEDHPLVRTLLEVYRQETGREEKPVAIGGGTYARALKTGVAFGMGYEGSSGGAHEPDEFVTLESFLVNARIYAHMLKRLVC